MGQCFSCRGGSSSSSSSSSAAAAAAVNDAAPTRDDDDEAKRRATEVASVRVVQNGDVTAAERVHGAQKVDGVAALFESYRDSEEDAILSEGIERLCCDLRLSPEQFEVLVLAWRLDAAQMCRFTRQEFVHGVKAMRADTLDAIAERLPEIRDQLDRDPDMFKDFYRFTFKFGLDSATGQRTLPLDVAIALWRLVFTVREPPILGRWLAYLDRHPPHFNGIPKDTWYMFLNFSDAVGVDLGSYDDTEAWPSLFDDFVEYENDQMNQNVATPKGDAYKCTVDD